MTKKIGWWLLFFSLIVFALRNVLEWVGGPRVQADELVAAVATYLLLKDKEGMS